MFCCSASVNPQLLSLLVDVLRSIVELKIVKRTKSYNLRLVSLPIHNHHSMMFAWSDHFKLKCLHAAKTTWTHLNFELAWFFSPKRLWKFSYGSVKIFFEIQINCFLLNEPKSDTKFTVLSVIQRKTRYNFSDRITSAGAITGGCYGKVTSSSASKDSFKTTFCSFSPISKPFLNKMSDKFVFLRHFTLISEKWLLLALEYPFNTFFGFHTCKRFHEMSQISSK